MIEIVERHVPAADEHRRAARRRRCCRADPVAVEPARREPESPPRHEQRRRHRECRTSERNLVVGRIGQPQQLQRRRPERHFGLDRPQRNASILRIGPDELAKRERIDDVEHPQAVRLAPHDLLLADAQESAADMAVDVELPQLGIRRVAEEPASIEAAALALPGPAGFQLSSESARTRTAAFSDQPERTSPRYPGPRRSRQSAVPSTFRRRRRRRAVSRWNSSPPRRPCEQRVPRRQQHHVSSQPAFHLLLREQRVGKLTVEARARELEHRAVTGLVIRHLDARRAPDAVDQLRLAIVRPS